MNITLNNGSIDIDLTDKFTGNNWVYKIYVDDINNENMLSTADENHTVVFQDDYSLEEPIDLDVTQYSFSACVITIFFHDDDTQEDSSESKFLLDEEFVYYNVVNMVLTNLGKNSTRFHKERVVTCHLRLQLLKYSIEHNLINESIRNFIDLIRILGIDDNPCDKYITAESRNSTDYVWNPSKGTESKRKPCVACGTSCPTSGRKSDMPLHRWITVE